jgi:hypothetical protein
VTPDDITRLALRDLGVEPLTEAERAWAVKQLNEILAGWQADDMLEASDGYFAVDPAYEPGPIKLRRLSWHQRLWAWVRRWLHV